MKTFHSFLLTLVTVTLFSACERNEPIIVIPSNESIQEGVNSINVHRMSENSLKFELQTFENEKYEAFFDNEDGLIKFGIGNIHALFDEGVLTLMENSDIINVVDFNEKTSTGEISQEQDLLIAKFVNALLDISGEKFEFILEENSSTTLRAAKDSKCNLNWSRRRAERKINESIEKKGGCAGGQRVAVDCVCAATDYLCVCCGDCG